MATSTAPIRPAEHPDPPPATKKRSLWAACLAHALHDGYTDGLYAFLPIWQAQFGLSYAMLAALRALYFATMGGLQMPAVRVLRGVSSRVALILSTVVAAAGLLIMALPTGLAGLCIGLAVAGIGSSIQHPRASMLVIDSYGKASRGPLGIYNFAGDLGKAALPALVAVLLPVLAWQPVLGLMAGLGIALALALAWLAPATLSAGQAPDRAAAGGRGGFGILIVIGTLDTATRMGYLLFLPFLIQGRGGDTPEIGLGLALLFIGGAFGKATCGWLGERMGVIGSVMATKGVTALLILATLFTPLTEMMIVLPALGVVLNGTSSVLYGAVPDLASKGDLGRAFAVFYTFVIGSGGLAPIAYGAIADVGGQTVGVLATVATTVLIVPLALSLRPALRR